MARSEPMLLYVSPINARWVPGFLRSSTRRLSTLSCQASHWIGDISASRRPSKNSRMSRPRFLLGGDKHSDHPQRPPYFSLKALRSRRRRPIVFYILNNGKCKRLDYPSSRTLSQRRTGKIQIRYFSTWLFLDSQCHNFNPNSNAYESRAPTNPSPSRAGL